MSDTIDVRKDGGISVPRLAGDLTVTGDVSEDFVLPDYMPAISRILRLESRAIPEDRYIGQGSAEFSGTVAYTLLYACGDSRICSVSLNSDYSGRCELPQDTSDCAVTTCVESSSCRLSGPRKLSLRSKLRTRVLIFFEEPFAESSDMGRFGGILERLTEKKSGCRTRFYESKNIKLTDSMPEGEGEPVFCSASVYITGAIPKNDAVIVTGEVIFKTLFSSDSGGAEGSDRRYGTGVSVKHLPFERTVRTDGVAPEDRVWVEGVCVSASVGDDGSGASGCETIFDLSIAVCHRENFEICLDAYHVPERSCSKDRTSVRCQTKKLEFTEAERIGGNFTFSAAARRDGTDGERICVEDVCVTPEITSLTCDGKRAVITGNAKINVILRERNAKAVTASDGGPASPPDTDGGDDSDGSLLSSGEFQSGFRYECDAPIPAGEIFYSASPVVLSSSGRIDSDKLRVDAEIGISGMVWSKNGVTAVQRASVEALPSTEDARSPGGFVIVYPDGSESLWDIGKRLKVSASRIAELNGIEADRGDIKTLVPKDGSALMIDMI